MRVRYYCHYAALTGYGRAARDYLLALHRFGGVELEIAVFGEPGAACRSPEARYAELDRFARPWQLVEGKADVEVYHAQPRLLAKVEGPGWAARDAAHLVHGRPKRVALTTWETSRLPDDFAAGLARFDRVLVPSEFCADVICGTTHGIDPIGAIDHPGILGDLQPITRIIPHCFDPDFWVVPPAPRRDDGIVRFYSVGAWGERKNMLGVLRAYLSEFSKRDTVHLLLYVHNVDIEMVRATIAASGLAPNELPSLSVPSRSELGGDLDEVQLLELHASCDCFVTATRGEGWGLGIFEAAILGRHIIAPLWGGQSDYLDHYGLVDAVPYQLTPCFGGIEQTYEIGAARVSMTPGQTCRHRWADPDLTALAARMRYVYEMKKGTAAVPFLSPDQVRDERLELEKKFSYKAVGPMFATTLREMIE